MNKKSIWILVVVVIVIILVAVFAKKPSQERAPLKVGAILMLSGQYAFLGDSVKNSMQLSQSNLPNKDKVQLIFEDDKYNTKDAVTAFRKLNDIDKVDILITFGSPAVEVTKPEINKSDKIMLILGDELSHDKDRVFEFMPQAAGLYDDLVREAAKRYQSISVVYASDNNLFVTDHDVFVKGAPASVKTHSIAVQSGSDMKTEAAQVAKSGDQAFTLFAPIETGIKFLKEYSKYPAKNRPQLICDPNIALSIDNYLKALDKSIFEGCISTTMSDTKTPEFIVAYKKAFNSDPQFGADYSYDVVQILGKLADMDKSEWVKYLNGLDYTGMSGKITLDETGTRPSVGEFTQFKDGKFVKMQ